MSSRICQAMFIILYGVLAPKMAHAISFTSFDARSMAMGGAGVATAKPYNAVLFNPALLMRGQRRGPRYFIRPHLGARLIDRDNFIDSVDAFQAADNSGRLDTALMNFDLRLADGVADETDVHEVLLQAREVTDAASALFADYQSLSDKPLRVAVAGGLSVGYAGRQHAFAGSIRQNRIGGARVNLSRADIQAVTSTIDTADQIVDAVEFLLAGDLLPLAVLFLTGAVDQDSLPDSDDVTSTLEFQGAEVTETAFSYAFKPVLYPGWLWGITFKHIRFTAIDYEERLPDAEVADFNDRRFQRAFNDLNLDLGLARRFANHARLGFVIRNMIPYDYQTVRNNTIKLRPLARVGIAWEPPRYTLTADLDVTANDPLGFDPDKRYLTMGAEWRAWRNTALRAGYRVNTVNGSDLWSIGVGLGPQHAHFDIAVAAQGDELGFALQFAGYF